MKTKFLIIGLLISINLSAQNYNAVVNAGETFTFPDGLVHNSDFIIGVPNGGEINLVKPNEATSGSVQWSIPGGGAPTSDGLTTEGAGNYDLYFSPNGGFTVHINLPIRWFVELGQAGKDTFEITGADTTITVSSSSFEIARWYTYENETATQWQVGFSQTLTLGTTYIVETRDGGQYWSYDTLTIVSSCALPDKPTVPTGTTEFCLNPANTTYTTAEANEATAYVWTISPSEAGTISGTGTTATIDWSDTYTGEAQVSVTGENTCGQGETSEALTVIIRSIPEQPATPIGTTELCTTSESSEYVTTETNGASSYIWSILPNEAGTISETGTTATVTWNGTYSGEAQINVIAENTCGQSVVSNSLAVSVNQSTYITTLLNRISELETQVATANDSIGVLNTDLVTVNDSIVTLNTDLSFLSDSIIILNTALELANDSIATLNTELTTANGTIETLQTDNTQLQSDLTVANDSIATLNTNLTTANGIIETLQSGNTQLQSDLTTATDSIATLNTELITANGTIETLQTENSQLQSDLTTARDSIATLNTELTTATDSIATLNTELSTANGTIETLQTENTQLQSDLTTANTTIGELQAQIAALQNGYAIEGDTEINNTTTDAHNYTLTQDGSQITEQLNWILTDNDNTVINNTVANNFNITANELEGGDYWLICRHNNSFVGMQKITASNSTSIANINKKSVSIYPNPGTDYIVIEGLSEKSTIRIYSINGNLVKSVEPTNNQINVSDLTSGSYFIKISDEKVKITKLFIKK